MDALRETFKKKEKLLDEKVPLPSSTVTEDEKKGLKAVTGDTEHDALRSLVSEKFKEESQKIPQRPFSEPSNNDKRGIKRILETAEKYEPYKKKK